MRRYIFILLVFSSACTAYHHGGITASNESNSSLSVVDFAHGYAKVNRFLFIGGANRDVLIADAKRNLLLNYPLQDGQFFTNYIVDFKETFYFYGIHSTTVTITAEVVSEENSDLLNDLREEVAKKSSNYQLGQKVFFKKASSYTPAKIISLEKNGAVVGYFDTKDRYRIKRFSYDKIVPESNTDLKP